MKLVVAIKAVASLYDDEPELLDDGTDVDPDYLEWDLNEWDTFALEEAVQLRDAEGGEVVVATVGDEEADEALRECLAKGADRAIRIWDEDADLADPLVVARVLAAAVGREQPDLVLCGVQSSDFASGAVGAALASNLGLPRAAVVEQLTVAAGVATVSRELEGGLAEELELALPALLTVQTGINEPRYASLRAIKQAEAEEIDVLEPGSLGLAEEDLDAVRGATVRRLSPPRVEEVEMIDGSPEEVADRLLAVLRGEDIR